MISVIIPVYNCKDFIEQAIASVLQQGRELTQIILVDDGSIDGSSELCDEVARKHDNIDVIHQVNAGVSAARNVGINYVLDRYVDNLTGRYIAFLDADDCWEPGFLDDSILDLLKQKHDLIGFQSCTCNQSLQKTSTPKALDEGTIHGGANSVWMHSGSSFAAMLYSCEFLNNYNLRFQNGLKYSENKIFSMQCMYLAKSIYLNNRLMYLYRITDGSAMGRRKFGIAYYTPIIFSYLEMDRQMEPWANEKRGVLLEGRRCANQYTMDMIREHYQHWGKKKMLDAFMDEHNELIDVVSGSGQYQMLKPHPEHQKYMQNSGAYIVIMYIKGSVFHFARSVRRIVQKYI